MYCLDYARDYRRTILIAGSGRSGTTWLSNLVNYKNEYRDVFEPFHPGYVPAAQPFSYNRYLRPADPHPELVAAAKPLLDGSFQNGWTARNNRRRLAGRRIVKDIHSTHFLKWLSVRFPGMPIVFVVRHPLAVVESRQALGWPARLELFLAQPDLIADHLQPALPEIEKVMGLSEQSFERNLFFWCIENFVPLRQFCPGEMHLTCYEWLITDPEKEARRLFQFLHKPFEARALQALSNPSSQTRPDSAVHARENPVERWRRAFSPAQITRASEILGVFGLDRIYTDAVMPRLALPALDRETFL